MKKLKTYFMTRGDTKVFQLKRKNLDGVITELPDKMYFTFKDNFNQKDFHFQKTLEKGIIYDNTSNYYYITIEPEDSNSLQYGTYVFDIEIIDGKKVTTLVKAYLIIEEEVTFSINE